VERVAHLSTAFCRRLGGVENNARGGGIAECRKNTEREAGTAGCLVSFKAAKNRREFTEGKEVKTPYEEGGGRKKGPVGKERKAGTRPNEISDRKDLMEERD